MYVQEPPSLLYPSAVPVCGRSTTVQRSQSWYFDTEAGKREIVVLPLAGMKYQLFALALQGFGRPGRGWYEFHVDGPSVEGSFFAATRTLNIQPSIFLIRQLVDEVDFKFNHGTELRMRRRKSEERQRHDATAMYCRAGACENSWTFSAEVSASAQTSAQRSRITSNEASHLLELVDVAIGIPHASNKANTGEVREA
jgi:hypothetical protein